MVPREGMLFYGIIQGKILTFRGKSNFVHEYIREFAKNIKLKLFLDIHQEPIRCWLKKKWDKKSHATVRLSLISFPAPAY
jgi:hypothetical protein